MSKWVLTGSRGFIGSRLAMNLINKGEQVRSIPRDLLYNYYELKKYLELEKPDYIIHLAAWGNHSTQQDLDKIVTSNIGCTTTLLQASKDVDYKTLVNTSTSSVTLPRQTFYSASKKATEDICHAFFQEYNKPIVSIRPYSVYGVGEANHRFIPNVIRASKVGAGFDLSPKAKHDWIYIDDFINGVEKVVENIELLKGLPINIGTGTSYSNQEIVDIIEEIHGEKLDYVIDKKMRIYDSENWVADNSVLQSIGWKQKTNIYEGLKKTYEHY